MEEKNKIICKICNYEFKNKKSLTLHLRSHKISSKDYFLKYLKKNEEEGKCKNCKNESIIYGLNGYSEFCSKKCLHIYLTTNDIINSKRRDKMKKQWNDRNSMFNSKNRKEKLSKSLKGKKFSNERKQNMSESHLGKSSWNKGLKNCFSRDYIENKRNNIKNKWKDPNSKYNSNEFREKVRQQTLNGHAIYMLKKMKTISKAEKLLYGIVKEIFSEAEQQYNILNYVVDIALPRYKIVIEYDGYFHFDTEEHKEYHKQRQLKIENEGWKFYRVTMYDKFPSIEEVKNNIEKLLLENNNNI